MAAVAHRWKTQLNENAKAWALFEPMPEANHNAIEGSINPRELSDALYVVQLRDRSEPEHIGERYRVVEELLGERSTNRGVVWAEGPSPLARVLTRWPRGSRERVSRNPLPDRPDAGYTVRDVQGAARQGDRTPTGATQ